MRCYMPSMRAIKEAHVHKFGYNDKKELKLTYPVRYHVKELCVRILNICY